MTTYLAPKEIHILGAQRTGQHAIAAWIIGHFNNVCYKNGFISKKKTDTNRGLTPPWWLFDKEQRPDLSWQVCSKPDIPKEQDAIILGSEYLNPYHDFYLDPDWEREQKAAMCERCGVDEFAQERVYVLVLRSPWNHLASVLKWRDRWYLKKKERFIACWLMMAREYMGITDIVPSPKIALNFDRWFSDIEYRKVLSERLGMPFSDDGLGKVMRVGSGTRLGSSFDKMTYESEGQKMKVLERWREYADNKVEFTNVLTMNKELVALSEEIFGPFPFEL